MSAKAATRSSMTWVNLSSLLISAIVLLLAGRELKIWNQFAGVIEVSKLIERGERLEPKTVMELADRADGMVSSKVCNMDLLKAGGTLVLGRLERTSSLKDYHSWLTSTKKADAFFRHALACVPNQGNFWARLAMVRQQLAEEPAEVLQLLQLSQRYAPAELTAIKGRLLVIQRASGITLERVTNILSEDLGVICRPQNIWTLMRFPKPSRLLIQYLPSSYTNTPSSKNPWCGSQLAGIGPIDIRGARSRPQPTSLNR